MTQLKCCFYNTLFLVALFCGPVANANTDLLNLSAYSEGAALPYGENVIVGQEEGSTIKWVTGNGVEDGRLKFPVNISGDFELFLKVKFVKNWSSDYARKLFLTADEYQITLTFFSSGVSLRADQILGPSDQSNAWRAGQINTVKLSVKGNVAKLYINDVFSQKLTDLKQGLTYSLLLFAGLKKNNQLYELKIDGSSGATPTPISSGGESGSTSSADAPHAIYDPSKGELYVPFVDVPGPFGGIQTYEIYLKQKPMGFSFDLDMGRVKLR
jgi:hypothetical protein